MGKMTTRSQTAQQTPVHTQAQHYRASKPTKKTQHIPKTCLKHSGHTHNHYSHCHTAKHTLTATRSDQLPTNCHQLTPPPIKRKLKILLRDALQALGIQLLPSLPKH